MFLTPFSSILSITRSSHPLPSRCLNDSCRSHLRKRLLLGFYELLLAVIIIGLSQKRNPLFWYNRFCTFFIRFRGRWISLTLIRSLTRKVLPESQPTQHICILEIIFHASEVNRNDAWKRRRARIEWNLFQRGISWKTKRAAKLHRENYPHAIKRSN